MPFFLPKYCEIWINIPVKVIYLMSMVKNVNLIKEKMNQYQIFCVLEGHKCIIIFGQNLEIPDIVPAYLLT